MSDGENIGGRNAVADVPEASAQELSPRERRAAERLARKDAAMVDEVVAKVKSSAAIKLALLGMKPFILARLNEENMTIDDLRRVLNASASLVIEEVLRILQNGKNGRS